MKIKAIRKRESNNLKLNGKNDSEIRNAQCGCVENQAFAGALSVSK